MLRGIYRIEGTIVYLLSLIAFIGVIDTSFLISIISPYALALGASASQAGLIAGLYSIVAIPASVLAGLMMDRIGRWRLLRLGLTLDFISMALYYFAFDPYSLMVTRVIHAIGGSMLFPSGISLVAKYSSRDKVAPGVSIFLIFIAVSVAAGSVTSATVVSLFGFKQVFILLGAIIGLGALLSLIIPTTLDIGEVSRRSINLSLMRFYGDNVVASVAMIFILYLSFGFIVGGYPVVVRDVLGLSERVVSGLVGMFIGVSTIVSIPMMYITGHLLSRGYVKALSVIGLTALFMSLASLLNPSEGGFFISALLLGPALAILMVTSTFLAVAVNDELRGVTTGLQQTFNILGIAIGAPLSGVLSGLLGSSLMVVPMAAIIPTGILILNKIWGLDIQMEV